MFYLARCQAVLAPPSFLVRFAPRRALSCEDMMSDDAELLRRYATERSEAAFAELVRRHVDLVYSAALRMVYGDAHCAQDLSQQVFCELARQAARLARHPSLAAWLYTTTRQM